MKITACSIVKNEAHNIARSIESYKGAVDEIIIVDTGSTDSTVELCKAYGAKTLFYEWNSDFSAAKNYALQHAKGDWIIFLDADEWFVPKLSRKTVTDVLKQIDNIADGLMTTMCEYNDKVDKVYARELTTRIFRNSPRIKFHGSIHERLMNSDSEITQAHCPDIEIFHSGYANGLVEEKSKRNINILYNIYNKGNISTSLYFYLFRENYILGNDDEAIKFYELFIKQGDADKVIKNDNVIICIYEFMYRVMARNLYKFKQQDLDNLLDNAYKKYPKLPMHSYLIGCENMKVNYYTESYNWLSNAIKLNNQYSEPFTNSFVTYLNDAYYKLGYISQEQGKLDQALTYYMEAVKLASMQDLATILPRLIKIVEDQPEEEIILFLNSLLDMKKKESVEAVLGALKQTRLHKAFVYYAIKYNQELGGQDETTYIAMILTGQAELAVETAIEASGNYRAEGSHDNEEHLNFEYDDGVQNVSEAGEKTVYKNWHVEYASVGILYSKDMKLYTRFKDDFSLGQNAIMKAYLEGYRLEGASNELRQEHITLYNLLLYILDADDLQKFMNIMD